MHQDVYNEAFDGEGAPAWAVCTNNVRGHGPARPLVERVRTTAAADIAFRHFWNNDVRGDLQGQYDPVGDVAQAFRGNPWVIGYDPFNEPFSTSLVRYRGEHFDAQLQCFYTGRGTSAVHSRGAPALTARGPTRQMEWCRRSCPMTRRI